MATTTPPPDTYALTDDQLEFRDAIRKMVVERVAPRAAEIDAKGEYPWDLRKLFAEHDLFGLPFGEEFGGTFGLQPLKFAAMERDASSGNDYNHARFQSPSLGRFLSPDRIGGKTENPQSWNRYAYALGNPLKYIDPTGLDAEFAIENRIQMLNRGQITEEYFHAANRMAGAGALAGLGVVAAGAGAAAISQAAPGLLLNAAVRSHGAFEALQQVGFSLLGIAAVRGSLERLATSDGSVQHIATRLTQTPETGRALSVAVGRNAVALAAAARSSGQIFSGDVPTALINKLIGFGLIQARTTTMNGVTGTELRISAKAAEFIIRFLHPRI